MMASAAPAEVLCLRDGLTVSVRSVTPDDEHAAWEFLTDLSIHSRRLRFGVATDLRAEAHRRSAGDDADHHGVVATAPGRGVVGHAIYVRIRGHNRAEVAVEVADDLHHMGLATLLIIRLAEFAEQRQITASSSVAGASCRRCRCGSSRS
jgi:acetyltransferase